MIVAAVRGTCITALAISSAVRSCSSRCRRETKPRRGRITMQKTSGSRTASATSSSAARSTRRSSHSTISRLMLAEAVFGSAPVRFQTLGDQVVDVEVHRAHGVGVERVAVEQRPLGRQVVVVDEDDDPVHANVHAGLRAVRLEGLLFSHVLADESASVRST